LNVSLGHIEPGPRRAREGLPEDVERAVAEEASKPVWVLLERFAMLLDVWV
jgi:hypothetical protein